MSFDEPTSFPTPADFFPVPDKARAAPVEIPLTDAERKRRDRAARREAGLPDPRVVDAAILSAFITSLAGGKAQELILKNRSTDKVLVFLRPVLKDALNSLVLDKGLSRDMATQLVMRRLRLG